MYIGCYGIAPHFKRLLENRIKNNAFVLMFDESLNNDFQKKQTDFLIRYWDGNRVMTSAAAPTSKAKTDSINILADVLPEEMP